MSEGGRQREVVRGRLSEEGCQRKVIRGRSSEEGRQRKVLRGRSAEGGRQEVRVTSDEPRLKSNNPTRTTWGIIENLPIESLVKAFWGGRAGRLAVDRAGGRHRGSARGPGDRAIAGQAPQGRRHSKKAHENCSREHPLSDLFFHFLISYFLILSHTFSYFRKVSDTLHVHKAVVNLVPYCPGA